MAGNSMATNLASNASSNLTDFDEMVYLAGVLGPQRQPLQKLIPLTIIYIVMSITGLIGNLSVCCVILRIPSMRSATNYYLFSLAVSDLLILLLGLPNDLHVYWQQYPWIFGQALCRIRALVSEMTSYSSVLIIVAFSMERYIAICHPLYSYTMSGLRRANKIIAAVWIVSSAAATPYAVFTKIHYVRHPLTNEEMPESAFCVIYPAPHLLFEFSSLFFFLIPMTIMIFLYLRMGLRIRKTTSFGKNTAVHGESRQVHSKKVILKMLAAVVVAFFVCWAPFHGQRLLYVAYYEYQWKFVSDEVYQQINEKLFYITGCFYYFSSTVNPILYNVLSVKYRNAFKETLCGRKADSTAIHNPGALNMRNFYSAINMRPNGHREAELMALKTTRSSKLVNDHYSSQAGGNKRIQVTDQPNDAQIIVEPRSRLQASRGATSDDSRCGATSEEVKASSTPPSLVQVRSDTVEEITAGSIRIGGDARTTTTKKRLVSIIESQADFTTAE